MEIRAMKIDDYDSVVDVWKRAGIDYRPGGRESLDSMKRQMKAFGGLMLVAEDEGRVIGVALGSHDCRKGWINRLAVVPEMRRKGVANMLLARLEEEFAACGIGVVAALVSEDNMRSARMFKNSGFKLMKDINYFSKRQSADI